MYNNSGIMYLLSFSISPNETLNVSAASNFPGTNIPTGAADTTTRATATGPSAAIRVYRYHTANCIETIIMILP